MATKNSVTRRAPTSESQHKPRHPRPPDVRVRRAYDPPAPDDGYRVLVDRLWPRGVSRAAVALDAWLKDVAPSDELRRWFAHDEARWSMFAARYRDELTNPPAAGLVDELAARAATGTVTLVFAARDEQHNNAVVLRDRLVQRARRAPRGR